MTLLIVTHPWIFPMFLWKRLQQGKKLNGKTVKMVKIDNEKTKA